MADQDDKARELFRRGKEYYSQGQYEEAIGAFKSAAEIRPSPLLDHNIGRCYDKLGNPTEAIAAYERYLKGKPYATNRDTVRQRIEELKKTLASRSSDPSSQTGDHPPEEPEAAPSPPSLTPAPSPPVTPPSRAEEPGMSQVDGPAHEATGAPAAGPGAGRRATPPPRKQDPYQAPGKREKGPIYKQWWFWAGCVGAAAILGFIIATAATNNNSGGAPSTTGGLHISF